MRLQSSEDIVKLPVSEFVKFIYKTEELGLIQVAKEIVWRHGSLDNKDSSGWNPLCWAISKGYEAGVALLLDGGANPDCDGSPQGIDALELAVKTGHVVIEQLILSSIADRNTRFGHQGHQGRHDGASMVLEAAILKEELAASAIPEDHSEWARQLNSLKNISVPSSRYERTGEMDDLRRDKPRTMPTESSFARDWQQCFDRKPISSYVGTPIKP
jgi:ankyrin repeat protein